MSTHTTGAQLAWVHYLLRSQLDSVDPLVSARIRREVKARVLDPFLADIDYDAMRADKTMLLNKPSQDIALSLMTPLRPDVSVPGVIGLGDASLLFKADVLTVTVEPIDLKDGNLRGSWGEKLYRIVLRPVSPVEKGDWILRLVSKQTGADSETE